jgi:plastocyanin
VLVAALSTGHKVGLGVVAAIFISFALASSFLAPRRWPDFPGRQGLSVFIIVSFVLFGAMLTAVEVFGAESEKSANAAEGPTSQHTIHVTESEYHIALPALKTVPAGDYTFVVRNAGHVEHNLVVGSKTTPLIQPGQTVTMKVALGTGTVKLFCSVDDHRALGMNAKITVG